MPKSVTLNDLQRRADRRTDIVRAALNYVAQQKKVTGAQLLLRWPRNVAEVEFSLSSVGYLSITHSFSVISENIAIDHVLPET